MKKMIETPYMRLWEEEDILHCIFTDGLTINLDIAKDCVTKRIAFSKGQSYRCMIDMSGVKDVNKAARDYFAKEGAEGIIAGALIAGSALNMMLGNLFLQINKPKVPSKLFTNKIEALHWLEAYKEIH